MTIRGIFDVRWQRRIAFLVLFFLWSQHAYAAPLEPGERAWTRMTTPKTLVATRPVAIAPRQMYEHDCVVAAIATRYGLSVSYIHEKINTWYGDVYPFGEMGIDYAMVDAAMPGYNLNESRPATDANLAAAPHNTILSYAGHAWNLRAFDRAGRTVTVYDVYTGDIMVLSVESDNGYGIPWHVQRKVSLPTEPVERYETHFNARLVGR